MIERLGGQAYAACVPSVCLVPQSGHGFRLCLGPLKCGGDLIIRHVNTISASFRLIMIGSPVAMDEVFELFDNKLLMKLGSRDFAGVVLNQPQTAMPR